MAEFCYNCPACGGDILCSSEWQGMQIECPLCHKQFVLEQDVSVAENVVPEAENIVSEPEKENISVDADGDAEIQLRMPVNKLRKMVPPPPPQQMVTPAPQATMPVTPVVTPAPQPYSAVSRSVQMPPPAYDQTAFAPATGYMQSRYQRRRISLSPMIFIQSFFSIAGLVCWGIGAHDREMMYYLIAAGCAVMTGLMILSSLKREVLVPWFVSLTNFFIALAIVIFACKAGTVDYFMDITGQSESVKIRDEVNRKAVYYIGIDNDPQQGGHLVITNWERAGNGKYIGDAEFEVDDFTYNMKVVASRCDFSMAGKKYDCCWFYVIDTKHYEDDLKEFITSELKRVYTKKFKISDKDREKGAKVTVEDVEVISYDKKSYEYVVRGTVRYHGIVKYVKVEGTILHSARVLNADETILKTEYDLLLKIVADAECKITEY